MNFVDEFIFCNEEIFINQIARLFLLRTDKICSFSCENEVTKSGSKEESKEKISEILILDPREFDEGLLFLFLSKFKL
jgi:hypothetical protein